MGRLGRRRFGDSAHDGERRAGLLRQVPTWPVQTFRPGLVPLSRMDPELTILRRELAYIERGRGHRYPAALRDRVARWTRTRRGGGASWQDVAAELEIAVETLKRWTILGEGAKAALIPVELIADARRDGDDDREFRLVTREGHRIEAFISPT
jgi:hypothetical protein